MERYKDKDGKWAWKFETKVVKPKVEREEVKPRVEQPVKPKAKPKKK